MKPNKEQHTIPKPAAPINKTDFYKNFRDPFPFNDSQHRTKIEAIEHLADLMNAWIKSSPEIVVFKEFLSIQDLLQPTFKAYLKRSPKLELAYNRAIQTIGVNREKLALFKHIDTPTMKHMQGRYDPEWRQRELELLEDKLKVTAAYNKAPSFVVVPSVGEFKKEIKESKENVSGETNTSSR